MYATVRLSAPVRTALTVPSSAVVRTGERTLVFVDLGGGRLAPQEVETGRAAGEHTEILSGVEPGQRVVTSAQFLLDSESNLAEVMRGMIGMGGTGQMEDMEGMDMKGADMKGMQMPPGAGGEPAMLEANHRVVGRHTASRCSWPPLAVTLAGVWAMVRTPVDAIPDLSDVQVIVMTEWAGQAPELVEDQVTYPLSTELLKVPGHEVRARE